MEKLIYIPIVLTFFLLIILLISALTQSGRRVKQRLSQIHEIEAVEEDEMKKPFVERALFPVYNGMFRLLEKLTPKNIAAYYQRIILQAGVGDQYTPIRILLLQILLSAVVTAALLAFLNLSAVKLSWILLAAVSLIVFIYPIVRFSSMASARQEKIKNSLPDVLDMLYISVEAGLSFDSAMKQTVSKMKGPLSQEISRAMNDITKGREREEALRSIGSRCQVEDVSSFITAVIQSELLGANIANMLRIQSVTMREKRRQRAEEAAMKIPTKMLFPMVLFMLPALFIVILGPALISIVRAFAG